MKNNRCAVNRGTVFCYKGGVYVILTKKTRGFSFVSLPLQEREILGTHDADRDSSDAVGTLAYGFTPLLDQELKERVLLAYNEEHPLREESQGTRRSFGALFMTPQKEILEKLI